MTPTQIFEQNPLSRWLLALGAATGLFIVLAIARRVGTARLAKLAARTATHWDDLLVDLLKETGPVFAGALGLVVGASLLELPERLTHRLSTLLVLAFLWQAGRWASVAMRTLLDRYHREQLAGDRGAETMISAMRFLLQLVIWAGVVLLALENLGVNVTALVTGFGVGGVAIALATQKILGDLFASLAIVLDKPFVLGDFIVVDDLPGSVEHIGLKTTRVRALSGEQLIFSNADLLGSRIRNFGRMAERRVLFTVGVTYDTPREKLERIPAMIRRAVEAQRPVRFDRSHFTAFGASSLDFETVYYVLSADYSTYMDIHQAINLSILEQFQGAGIEFAFPTRTVVLTRPAAES
jgi:small-conductance mechanosensitive channel